MPTHHRGSRREVRALDAFIKLTRAGDSLEQRLQPPIGDEGLTMGQFGVLEALHHLGPLSQCEIGRKLLRSNANVTTVIDNLEKASLVRRERSAEDRRVVHVHLTVEGRARIARVFPAHARRVADLMSALAPAEQRELGRLCRKLGLAATARRVSASNSKFELSDGERHERRRIRS
jgi:MarR family 2-MHQ and catechol resistance regulon transcriptional repressor